MLELYRQAAFLVTAGNAIEIGFDLDISDLGQRHNLAGPARCDLDIPQVAQPAAVFTDGTRPYRDGDITLAVFRDIEAVHVRLQPQSDIT